MHTVTETVSTCFIEMLPTCRVCNKRNVTISPGTLEEGGEKKSVKKYKESQPLLCSPRVWWEFDNKTGIRKNKNRGFRCIGAMFIFWGGRFTAVSKRARRHINVCNLSTCESESRRYQRKLIFRGLKLKCNVILRMALIWEEKIKISGTSQRGNMRRKWEEVSLAPPAPNSLSIPSSLTQTKMHTHVNIVSYNKPITCH